MPPYISIELPQNRSDFDYFDGYSLVFNLASGELFEIKRHSVFDGGRGISSEIIPPESICSLGEFRQLSPVPVGPAAH